MQQLSEIDASFLYLETESAPMHIGSVYLLDASTCSEPFTFNSLHNYIARRLPQVPRFRQRLVEVPLKLDHPYWVDDPEFDLNRHIWHEYPHQCGTLEGLMDWASSKLREPLTRDRPLWQIYFVDNLQLPSPYEKVSTAVVVKLHHSVVDGTTGEELMSKLLDFSTQPAKHQKSPEWQPSPLPSKAQLITGTSVGPLQTPFRLATMARDAAASAFYNLLIQRLRKLSLPAALLDAPKTRFNQSISDRREVAFFEIPLERLKAIKKQYSQVTLNDIVLTICSELLLRYLDDAEKPAKSICAMSPVSVRSTNIESPTGSTLSAMLISLATREPNLAARLRKIHKNATASQIYNQAISANRLTQVQPSSMLGLAARTYSEFQLAQKHSLLFNIPITNIPGPQAPMYFNGAEVISQLGTAPLFDGIALAIVIGSYNGKVSFTFTACPTAVPDLNHLVEPYAEVLAQLESDLETYQPESDSESTSSDNNNSGVLAGLVGDIVSLFANLFSNNPRGDEPEKK